MLREPCDRQEGNKVQLDDENHFFVSLSAISSPPSPAISTKASEGLLAPTDSLPQDGAIFTSNFKFSPCFQMPESVASEAIAAKVTSVTDEPSGRRRSSSRLSSRDSAALPSVAASKSPALKRTVAVSQNDEATGKDNFDAESVEDAERVYCTCRGIDDGSLMLQCGICEEWFHLRCVGLNEEKVAELDKFLCAGCSSPSEPATSPSKRKSSPTADIDISEPVLEKKPSKLPRGHAQPINTTSSSVSGGGGGGDVVRKSAQEGFASAFMKFDVLQEELGLEKITELSRLIEAALFDAYHEDSSAGSIAGPLYKSKFRSLLFNLKDERNRDLRDKLKNFILNRVSSLGKHYVDSDPNHKSLNSTTDVSSSEHCPHISPEQLVRMTSEELAPKCLKDEIEAVKSSSLKDKIIKEEDLSLVLGGIRKVTKSVDVLSDKDSLEKRSLLSEDFVASPALDHIQGPRTENSVPDLPSSNFSSEEISSAKIDGVATDVNLKPTTLAVESPDSILELLSAPSRYSSRPTQRSASSRNTVSPSSKTTTPTSSPPLPSSYTNEEWLGILSFPDLATVGAVALHHSTLSPPSVSSPSSSSKHHQKSFLLSEFGLCEHLIIQGRIEASRADAYLEQILASPNRYIVLSKVFSLNPDNQALSDRIGLAYDRYRNSKSGAKGVQQLSSDLRDLYSNLSQKGRYGVLISGNHNVFTGAFRKDWLVKDLYLVPGGESAALPPFLSNLENIQFTDEAKQLASVGGLEFWLVAVVAPAASRTDPSSNIGQSEKKESETFQYKPLSGAHLPDQGLESGYNLASSLGPTSNAMYTPIASSEGNYFPQPAPSMYSHHTPIYPYDNGYYNPAENQGTTGSYASEAFPQSHAYPTYNYQEQPMRQEYFTEPEYSQNVLAYKDVAGGARKKPSEPKTFKDYFA